MRAKLAVSVATFDKKHMEREVCKHGHGSAELEMLYNKIASLKQELEFMSRKSVMQLSQINRLLQNKIDLRSDGKSRMNKSLRLVFTKV